MKHRSDIVIKVLSLGVGLAVGIVLIAKVFFELSYDSFYKDIDRVYIINTWYSQNGDAKEYNQVSGGVAVGFMQEVPGVEVGTRTVNVFSGNTYADEQGNKIKADLVCADTCFFKVFDRPILVGEPVSALGKWGCAMVSRSFAEKILCSAQDDISSVIGRQIYNSDMEGLKLTIEGVYEDFPENGLLDYDILLSMETYGKSSSDNWLGNDSYKGYVKLMPGVDPGSLKDAIRKMQEAHQPLQKILDMGTDLRYFLVPYSTLHTSAPEVKSQVILLSIVAALLIIISLLNYILIVISSMVKRSKEVGVRKCYGAESKHIYGMLTKEALLHVTLSLVLAGAIIFAGRGIIENLLGVPFQALLVPSSVVAIVAVLVFVLAVSIVVPAELYQRIPVYVALKNYTENSRRWKLGLLGVQVAINIFLVVMMFIIGQQYKMVSHADTGYDYDNLYFISTYGLDKSAQARIVEALKAVPEVSGVAMCYTLPYRGSNGDNVILPNDDKQLFNIADQYECSDGFYDLMGIQFLEGRAPRDSSEMVVDEMFVARMADFADWSDGAVGKQLRITGHGNGKLDENGMDLTLYTVTGVYKRYLIGDLLEVDDRPSALFYGKLGSHYMPHTLFKVSPDALPIVRKALSKALDGNEVNIISYEEQMRAAYADSRKMRNTMALGAVFSLLIALLGLIGFIQDESLRRSKEMAIRKINGATTGHILGVFAGDVLKLSVVMAVIACLGAYFVAHRWLEQFADKVALSPLYFLGGSALVLLIVLIVVVINSLHIVHSNPVDSLKSE